METGDVQRQDIQLRAPHGPLARVFFGSIGAAVIAVVLYELGRALWPIGWWSPFFAIIVFGACWIGFKCLMAAVAGEDVIWTLLNNEMRFDRTSLLRDRVEIVRSGDVLTTAIKVHDWESRPNTFSIQIRLRSGEMLDTPEVDSKARAETLQAEIRSRLSVGSV
jgi:hypothetical protein